MDIQLAQKRLRAHWKSIPTLPYSPTFDGTLDDIECLDYLQYEGIAYVDGDETELVGLFWGHVFANLTECVWDRDADTALPYLKNAKGRCDQFRMYPTIRVREMINRSVPQFGKLGWAMSAALFEYLQHCFDSNEQFDQIIRNAIHSEQEFIASVRCVERDMR